ncbi:hypothetical protein BLX87_14760 [Bacillus sp. VT-16-64]|nr:hypothetical protein BLX87_14760 [Bacillus sp. VT-16-64]
MKSKIFKPFITLVVLAVLVFNFSGISASAANAKKTDYLLEVIDSADEEKGSVILKALQFNEDQTAFASFDEEFAKSNGLTEEEYVSIDVFFDLGYEEFMIFKAAKLELEDNDTPKSVTMSKADPTPPVAKLALVIAGMIFLGQALIKDLTSDLYKLGAKKFCGKYSKKYKPIKNSCKSLGYIK